MIKELIRTIEEINMKNYELVTDNLLLQDIFEVIDKDMIKNIYSKFSEILETISKDDSEYKLFKEEIKNVRSNVLILNMVNDTYDTDTEQIKINTYTINAYNRFLAKINLRLEEKKKATAAVMNIIYNKGHYGIFDVYN